MTYTNSREYNNNITWGKDLKMGKYMEKKKKWPILLLFWLMFIVLVAAVAYLSFQNGEDAKQLGKSMITKLAEAQHPQGALTDQEMSDFTYMIRQNGRVIAFLMIGIVGTITIHISCGRCNWFVKTCITMFVLVSIAYLTEWLKIYIPTRHYSAEEMMISMAAVITGFIVVSAATLTIRIVKGFFRLMTASHSL